MAGILGRRRKEREFIDFARSYLADAFPNPERKNCPTDEALRELARRPFGADSSLISHLSCCSPCFSAYSAHLKEAKPKPIPIFLARSLAVNARPVLALVALAIVVMVSFLALKRHAPVTVVSPAPIRVPAPSPPAPSVAAYMPVVIDLTSGSAIRGLENSHRPTQTLVSSKLDLTIKLPLGSEQGVYAVRIKSNSGVLWTNLAAAHRENGQTILHARADLAGLADGSYTLEVRSRILELTQPILLKASASH